MIKRLMTLACLAPLMLATATGIAAAQTASLAENAQERINNAGKLRMLSQQIPAAACNLSQGVATDTAGALLATSVGKFDTILSALEFGDPALNIAAPETRRKTLAALQEVRDAWQPLQVAASAMTQGTATDGDVATVLSENVPVLNASQRTLAELTEQYSNPNAVTRASLMMIDIAGRQLMLTQQMAKDACILAGNPDAEDVRAELQSITGIFEASLEALRFGMPAAGINAPPNPEISQGLQAVLDAWTAVKPMIDSVIAGEQLDVAENAAIFEGLNATLNQMDPVVTLYVAAAAPGQ